jgi:hypothetical protein
MTTISSALLLVAFIAVAFAMGVVISWFVID